MIENETTGGGFAWRKRAIATVGIAAAVVTGGVALASSASAADAAPVIKLTAPATIANDGSSGANQLFSVEVVNASSVAIPPAPVVGGAITTDALTVKFTVPTGVACTSVTLTAVTATPAAAVAPNFMVDGTSPSCFATANPYAQPANSDYKYTYQLAVNTVGGGSPTGLSGSVSSSAVLTATTNGVASTVATSNTATSVLAAPSAPALAGTPTAPTIYQKYSFNEVSSVGVPPVPQTLVGAPAQQGYSIFAAPAAPMADGTYVAGSYLNTTTTDSDSGDVYALIESKTGANFYLDLKTGNIVSGTFVGGVFTPSAVNETDGTPDFVYTITANNGKGGATVATPGIQAGSTARPTPGVGLGDVQSTPFSLPILFSDVATTSTFGTDIYGLSDNDAIKGFFDGTFRPGQAVTRAEFVNILANYEPQVFGVLTNGECTTIEPSAFSDVPNSSVFCEAIKTLSQDGIINGSGDGKFHPSSVVSRQEITAFAYRSFAYASTGNVQNGDATFTAPSPFEDVSATNVFAGDIQWAAKNNVVKGYTDGTFRPKSQTNRDATAAIIFRTGLTFP